MRQSRSHRRESALRQRYGLLLASLVVLFAVAGIAPGGRWQEVLVTALAAGTLVLALRAGEVPAPIAVGASIAGGVLVVMVAVLAVAGVPDSTRRRDWLPGCSSRSPRRRSPSASSGPCGSTAR